MKTGVYYHPAASRIALTTGKGSAGMRLQAQGRAGRQLDKPVPTFGLFYPACLPASRTRTEGGSGWGAWLLSDALTPHCQGSGGGHRDKHQGSGRGPVPGRCAWTPFLLIPGTTRHFKGLVTSEISYENDRRSHFSKSLQ